MLVNAVRSKKRLDGVHPDLISVVERAVALCSVDFMVIEGVRTAERQQELFNKGASRTLNSRHLTGHAVDLAPVVGGNIPWDDLGKFKEINKAMQAAAKELGVSIKWGGDFKNFFDGVHFELNRKIYP